MSTTQETQAASLANAMVAMVAQLQQTANQISAMSTQWTNLSAATLLNAFPTAAKTTTGGIGTADGSPNVANPINTGVVPGTALNRAISANDLASIMTYIQGVAAAIGGGAVSVNGAAASL